MLTCTGVLVRKMGTFHAYDDRGATGGSVASFICEWVSFSMFVPVALSPALRIASRPASASVPDLELASPGGTYSGNQDEFLEEPISFDGDLTVSRPHPSCSVLPPAQWPLSSAQARFLAELQGAVER